MTSKAIDVDPYDCEECGARGRVLESRKCPGYVRRRHECECGFRWTSYHSRLNPRSALRKLARLARRARSAETPLAIAPPPPLSEPPAPAPSSALAPVPARALPTHPTTTRRVARSSYLGR